MPGKNLRASAICCNACSSKSDIPAVAPTPAKCPADRLYRPGKACRLLIARTIMPSRISRREFSLASLALGSSLLARSGFAQGNRKYAPVIPGTGIRVARTGDDFESEDWAYYPQHPKSSWNIEESVREPGRSSRDAMGAEGAER